MRVAYVVSRYPNISETFIVREMQQLVRLGWGITICQLKWESFERIEQGLKVSQASVPGSQFGLAAWGKGLVWASLKKRKELRLMWQDFKQAKGDIGSRVKLLAILLTTLRMAQYINETGVQHVRAHFLHSEAVGGMWLARLLKVPYSVTAHTLITIFPRTIIEKVVRDASFCVAITGETLNLLTALRRTEDEIYLIHNGVDIKNLAINSNKCRKPDRPLIIAVGRLVNKKGFNILIQACALLKDKGIDYSCKIVGSGSQLSFLEQLIVNLRLDGYVSLTGVLPFDDVKALYAKATILIMPSRALKNDVDGLPTVIIEALAMGLPVIATTVAGIPELVIQNQTGILIPPEDEVALFSAMRLLIENEGLCHRLGDAGRKKVAQEYNIVKSVKQLDDLIRESIVNYHG